MYSMGFLRNLYDVFLPSQIARVQGKALVGFALGIGDFHGDCHHTREEGLVEGGQISRGGKKKKKASEEGQAGSGEKVKVGPVEKKKR